MPTNLTGTKINETFDQLLHVSDGPTATEKTVYSGTGVATALKLGTETMSGTFSDIEFTDASKARDSLGLGTMATQSAGSVEITGGTIDDVLITNASFGGLVLVEADKLTTKDGADGVSIEGTTIYAEGASTNIDISITPKGTGEVNVTNIDVLSGKVPFNVVTNRAYAAFYDASTSSQTGSTTDRTAVKWATASVTGAGITVVSNSRITLATAGTYRFNINLQFSNSENTDHEVVIWFAKNGTNIASSASKMVIPKSSTGGTAVFAIEIFETVAANDYIEAYWHTESTNVTLHYVAPVAASPGVTPAIPAVPPAIAVVERIA